MSTPTSPISPALAIGTAIAAPVVSGAGNLISGHLARKFSREMWKKQVKYQKEADALAFQRQVQLWNMQNAYDAPAAQMSRFAAAGLNPNLIYNQDGSSGSMPTVSGGSSAPSAPSASMPLNLHMPNLLGTFLQFKQLDLARSLNDAQVANIEADTAYKRALTNRSIFDLSTEEGLKDLKRALLEAGLDEKKANIILSHARSNLTNFEAEGRALSNQGLSFDNEYKSRTLEDRIERERLGNSYIRANIKYILSRKDLTDEQKKNLILHNSELSDYEVNRKYGFHDIWLENRFKDERHLRSLKYLNNDVEDDGTDDIIKLLGIFGIGSLLRPLKSSPKSPSYSWDDFSSRYNQ